MQPGAEVGPTFPKPRDVLSGRSPQAPLRGSGRTGAGGLPPGLLEETLGVPEIRMHFPEGSSFCGRACFSAPAEAQAAVGGLRTPSRPAPASPACGGCPASRALSPHRSGLRRGRAGPTAALAAEAPSRAP